MSLFSNEEIDFIKDNIRIEEEISKYVVLNKKDDKYIGYCPFHNDSKGKLYVYPSINNFKCYGCGFSGNIFKFVQKYMNFNFYNTVRYLIINNKILHEKYNYLGNGIVYVLRLTEGKYYIGYTTKYCNRMNSHFSGKGAKWTQKYRPIEIVEIYRNVNFKFEHDLTKIYMIKHRVNLVRGGDFPFVEIEHSEVRKDLRQKTNEGVFVLLLENSKYYIGYGVNLDSEIRKHFNGFGCDWTRAYKPIKEIERIRTRNLEETKKITVKYVEKYGWDNVRGYRWDQVDLE